MFQPLWHPSWVMYWLPFLISWKMGRSSPVHVPSLDVSRSFVVLLGPPNSEPLWDTAEQFRSTLRTEWFHPLQKALSLLWITLKMYGSNKEVKTQMYDPCLAALIALVYDQGTLYLESYTKMQFL